MNTLDAMLVIENEDGADYDDLIIAWQHLIDTGMVWNLQGFYGRTAKTLIEIGLCKEGDRHASLCIL